MAKKKEKKPTNPKFAQALMKNGVQHFGFGGFVDAAGALAGGGGPTGVLGHFGGSIGSGIGGFVNPLVDNLMQSNTYQAQLAPTQTTNYGGVINQSGQNALAGYGNAQAIQAQQQLLANALLAQSQGQGPNPAQAALEQATGQNVQNQAALMAGQRGAGANVGLMARQAAMQGAQTQQQAVGQSAVMQAQQQIAAQQALAQQQALMGQQNIQEQGINSNLYGSAAGAQNAQNSGMIQNYNMMQGINSGIAGANTSAHNTAVGGLINGASSAGSAALGKPPTGANGGLVSGPGTSTAGESYSNYGNMAYRGGSVGRASITPPTGKNPELPDHLHKVASIFHPHLVTQPMRYDTGGPVPGDAQVDGNSVKNDVVPAMLSPGEIVLPRSVTEHEDAPAKAAEFVKLLMERKEKGQSGYAKVAAAKRKGK